LIEELKGLKEKKALENCYKNYQDLSDLNVFTNAKKMEKTRNNIIKLLNGISIKDTEKLLKNITLNYIYYHSLKNLDNLENEELNKMQEDLK
tara:strand:+ start:378 stop:653 length:276 start_codon:yes stop_codon:yes gene_type:complete